RSAFGHVRTCHVVPTSCKSASWSHFELGTVSACEVSKSTEFPSDTEMEYPSAFWSSSMLVSVVVKSKTTIAYPSRLLFLTMGTTISAPGLPFGRTKDGETIPCHCAAASLADSITINCLSSGGRQLGPIF